MTLGSVPSAPRLSDVADIPTPRADVLEESREGQEGVEERVLETTNALVEQALEEGSDKPLKAQQEAAYSQQRAYVEGALSGQRERVTALRPLLADATHMGEANLAYVEKLFDTLELNPVEGADKGHFFYKRGGTEDRPLFALDAARSRETLEKLDGMKRIPGLSENERTLLSGLQEEVAKLQALDPFSTRVDAGVQYVRQSPHNKLAVKVSKYGVLIAGVAAGALGIGITLMRWLDRKSTNKMPSAFLLGPLIAWGILNWKSLAAPLDERVMNQVATVNDPKVQDLMRRYGVAGPGWTAITEALLQKPDTKAMRDYLAEPTNEAARKALMEQYGDGADGASRLAFAQMIKNGEFDQFRRALSRVTATEAKELVTDFVSANGARTAPDTVRPEDLPPSAPSS